MVKSSSGGLVYSTDKGKLCPGCSKPVAQCSCRAQQSPPKGDGTVRIRLEKAGRGGKAVSVVFGVPLAGDELAALAKQLKNLCGAGGSVKDGDIEIQGDHRAKLKAALEAKGFKVKLAGG